MAQSHSAQFEDKHAYIQLKTIPQQENLTLSVFILVLALRIHVSPECHEVLTELGGYHLVERGPVSMKVCSFTSTSF